MDGSDTAAVAGMECTDESEETMSSLHGDREIHRSGTGVLTLGKEIGIDTSRLADHDFDRSPKDIRVLFINPPVDFSVFYGGGAMDLSDTKSSSPPIGILHLPLNCFC